MMLEKPNPASPSILVRRGSGLKESTLELGLWLSGILLAVMRDIPDAHIGA